ncbi:hypothetical protein BESB_029120 [Besnoitia besnoiti]|uniref:Clu domain-containing protein n=1 Tax=Besnoitia besnoiti TaxID=94643 RepID=A0A2A9M758_BESBE|nr:uncharacterized protein BESB_029120 [Besnoitia besnoiti]PFH31477.1 hypothetical protein BESB_029120 [Besnoitia besnoiti]
MELFGDQYLRITIALPTPAACVALAPGPSAQNGETTRMQATVASSPTAAGVAGQRAKSAAKREQDRHESESEAQIARRSSSHPRQTDGSDQASTDHSQERLADSSPPATSQASADNASPLLSTVTAEVAFSETVADLRWVLLELLPSCFFTNYDIFFKGERVEENVSFSALSVEAGDVFHLVPSLYDEKSVRLHIRRFQEITVNASVLLMQGLPDPADPAGPYGTFLKPLVLLDSSQFMQDNSPLWLRGGSGAHDANAHQPFLELPADDVEEDQDEDAEKELQEGDDAEADKQARHWAGAHDRKSGTGPKRGARRGGSNGRPQERTPAGATESKNVRRGSHGNNTKHKRVKGQSPAAADDTTGKTAKAINLTRLLFRDELYGGSKDKAVTSMEDRDWKEGASARREHESAQIQRTKRLSTFLLKSPVTLKPRKKPKSFISLHTSDLNPPPPSRRLQGDLWYLELCTLEHKTLAIVCREEGFSVSSICGKKRGADSFGDQSSGRSLEALFPPNRVACPPEGHTTLPADSDQGQLLIFHTLSDLLCAYSPAYRETLPSLAPPQLDTDLPYHVMPALQAHNHFLATKEEEHKPDSSRLEEYLEKGAGVDPWEEERRWSEEVDALRNMPVETLQDHIDFEKASFKLFVEFQHSALQAAINVREGRIGGPGTSEASHSPASPVFDEAQVNSLCMQSESSSIALSSDQIQRGRQAPADGLMVPRSDCATEHLAFWGQMAIEKAGDRPLLLGGQVGRDASQPQDECAADVTSKSSENTQEDVTGRGGSSQSSSDVANKRNRRDWRELKAETRAYELLELLHAYQRKKAASDQQCKRRGSDPEANTQQDPAAAVGGLARASENCWQITAPYALLIDYAGCRLRCQSVSPIQLLAAKQRKTVAKRNCDRASGGQSGENKKTHGSEGVQLNGGKHEDYQIPSALDLSLFGDVLGLKIHHLQDPVSGETESRLLHRDARWIEDPQERQLHLLSLGSLCPVDVSRHGRDAAGVTETRQGETGQDQTKARNAEAGWQNERTGTHNTFEWLRPELMSAYLLFQQKRDEQKRVTESPQQVEGAPHLKDGASQPAGGLGHPSDSAAETSTTAAHTPAADGSPISVYAAAPGSSDCGPAPACKVQKACKNMDTPQALKDELRLRLEHEVCRRVPLLPAFFSEMQAWYKADLGTGFFFQSGSPFASTLREKTREAAAHILFKCVELTRSHQRAALVEHRLEYDAIKRELAARGGLAFPQDAERASQAAAAADPATAERNSACDKDDAAGKRTSHHGQVEQRESLKRQDGLNAEAGEGEQNEGATGAFAVTDEDRDMMELLGQDISLLDPSLDLEERSRQMADQLCSMAFFTPSSSHANEEASPHGVASAVSRLFNLNVTPQSGEKTSPSSHLSASDHSVLEEAANYLHAVAIPLVATLLGQNLCVTPLESSSLKSFFHSFGVNMRYLGVVTQLVETNQDVEISADPELEAAASSDAPSLAVRLLQVELTVRAAKWCFSSFLSPLRVGQLSPAIAHLMSCLFCPPAVQYPSKKFPLPSALRRVFSATSGCSTLPAAPRGASSGESKPLSAASKHEAALCGLAELTPETLWGLIRQRIREHFGYDSVPVERSSWRCMHSPSGRYAVLRGVASALGIQMKTGCPLMSVLGASSLWEHWGLGEEWKQQAGEAGAGAGVTNADRTAHENSMPDEAKPVAGASNSEVSTHGMSDLDFASPVCASPTGHRGKERDAAVSQQKEPRPASVVAKNADSHAAKSGCVDLHPASGGSGLSCWRAGGPALMSAGCYWAPLRQESIVQLFPVIKRDPVVSHLARHLLTAATQCYVLGWLDVALELFQQVLFVVHQLTGAVCREAALCYAGMGEVTLSLQDFLNAANNFQKALILTERCMGPDHPDTIDLHAGLGRTLVHFPGREYQERGLQHIHRAIVLLRLWSGDVPHPETPLLLVTAAKCLLKVYGPACASHLPEYLDGAVQLARRVRGMGPQFVAEIHSDCSQIYQALGDFRNALEHWRNASQLIASDPSVDTERTRELDERLLFLTQQAVLAAKRRKHEESQRAELLHRLRTVVTLKRHNGSPPAGVAQTTARLPVQIA